MLVDDEQSIPPPCRYVLKLLIILLASVGVALSVLASYSCQFLYFGPEALSEINLAFDDETEGWIGIFKYQTVITNNENEETVSIEECSIYENILNGDFPNHLLLACQYCALIAPGLALLAILVSTVELMCFKFFGSFTAASVSLLGASLFQCGTLGIFLIDRSLCFDAGSDGCKVGNATWFSASASVAFLASCILLCISPRTLPLMEACMQTNTKTNYNDDYGQVSLFRRRELDVERGKQKERRREGKKRRSRDDELTNLSIVMR